MTLKPKMANKEDWKKKWCRHCRCCINKENLPIKYEIIARDIKTKKELLLDKVCGNCLDNISYNEPNYNDDN